jgi:YbbR domain-containing protein
VGFGRRLGIFFTAIFVAALLWTYVHLSTPYETEIDIPVSVIPPKGVAVASGLPERLHARVRGAGWQILLMDFTRKAKIELDLTQRVFPLQNPTSLSLTSSEIMNGAKMPSEVRLLRVEPDTLHVVFGRKVRKQVPITPVVDIRAGPGYALVGTPIVAPAYVILEGSQEVLDSIQSFPTKPLVRSNLRESITEAVELSDTLSNLLQVVSTPQVTIRQSVQAIGERTFAAIPIVVEAKPTDKEVLLVPGFLSIVLRGGVEDLARLKPEDIRAYVMFDPVLFDTAEYVRPSVSAPQGIEFLSSEPDRVRFVIRRKQLADARP